MLTQKKKNEILEFTKDLMPIILKARLGLLLKNLTVILRC